jgi:response regulator RpfG family c-di-GMP phosphodiesterase
MPPEEAFKIIARESRKHFDPKLVKVFLRHREAFKKVDEE